MPLTQFKCCPILWFMTEVLRGLLNCNTYDIVSWIFGILPTFSYIATEQFEKWNKLKFPDKNFEQ